MTPIPTKTPSQEDFITESLKLRDYIMQKINTVPLVQAKIVINNKIELIDHYIEQYIENTDIPQKEKIEPLINALYILYPLPNRIQNTGPLQITWLKLASLISYIKQSIAITISALQKDTTQYEILATLLSDLLMDLMQPKELPQIPPPTSPKYRTILSITINTLQDTITLFDILIETTPFISKHDIIQWIQKDIEYYAQLIKIIKTHINEQLIQIYKKTKEEHVFLHNFLSVHLNYVNLAQTFKSIQQALNNEWQKHVNLSKLLPPNYPQNFTGILLYTLKETTNAFNQIKIWEKTKEIPIQNEDKNTPLYQELKIGRYYLKTLLITEQNYAMLLKIKSLNIMQQEKTQLELIKQIMIYEITMQEIAKNKQINKHFFETLNGLDYLEFFQYYLEAIALEAITQNNYLTYEERLRPYQEILSYTSPQTHPLLWLKYYLLKLYVETKTNKSIQIKPHYQKLQQIRTFLKENPKDYVSTLILLLTIQTIYKEQFEKTSFQQIIQEINSYLQEAFLAEEYVAEIQELIQEITKEYESKKSNMQKFYHRLKITPHDYTTWAIPQFKPKNQDPFPLQYFPFNRKSDRII